MNNTATRMIRSEEITIDMRICTILAGGKKPGEVYFAAIAPDMELTVITLDEAPDILPCFDESDASIHLPDTSLLLCYNPAQVLKMAGKRYLTGPVILVRTNMDGNFISLTIDDVYRFQKFLASHSVTLMADDQKLPCICMQDGKRCSGSIPYGYKRIPGDKQTLYVDEEAAAVVCKIFEMAANGSSIAKIAQTLFPRLGIVAGL